MTSKKSQKTSHIPRYIDLDYDFGWFIGIFIAEGNYNKKGQIRFSLNINETDIADKVEKILHNWGIKLFRFSYKNKNGMEIYFGDKLIKKLIGEIVGGNSARTKFIREQYILNTPELFRRGLFDGVYAGDGAKSKFNLTLSSEQLIKNYKLLANTLGRFLTFRARKIKNQTGKVFDCYSLTDSNLKLRNNFFPNRIVSIIKGNKSINMVDISIDGEYFLINDGIVTHNSNPVPQARKVKWMNGWEELGMWQKPDGKLTYNYKLGQEKDWSIRAIVGHTTKADGAREHPCQKPIGLMTKFIRYWSSPGDLVLDPFCGSGPVLVACKNTGRRFIGIDNDEKYCAVASNRLNQVSENIFK